MPEVLPPIELLKTVEGYWVTGGTTGSPLLGSPTTLVH
jgi:hypothetical protein